MVIVVIPVEVMVDGGCGVCDDGGVGDDCTIS